jgi:putative flippase GtrA
MAIFHIKHLTRSSLMQFFRYGLVGIVSNLIAYLIYLLITYYGVSPKIAMSILYITGATVGFWGNRRWTFAHNGSFFHTGIKYIISHSLGYLLNLSILVVFVDLLGYAHQFVQAVAILIVAGFLFTAFKLFVFRKIQTGGDK